MFFRYRHGMLPILDRRDPRFNDPDPRARARPSAVSSSDDHDPRSGPGFPRHRASRARRDARPGRHPVLTLAWAGFDGDELVFATFFGTDQRKLRNLRRDPRVALSFEAKEHTGEGLHPYVVIHGRAHITEGGALEVMDALAEHYIGPGAVFPMRDVPPGVVTHVTIDEIYGQGPWREERGGGEGI